MDARPERVPRKPTEDRRREIADAALRVIAARGVGGFTALAIARELGLSDAALFRHFPSKEAIVAAAIDRVEELLFDGFPPRDADPVERLGAFFQRRVLVIRDNPGISSLVAGDELAKAGSAAGVRRVAGFRRRSTGFVRECLSEAHGAGLLAPELGVEEAAVVLLGALLALGHGRLADGGTPVAALAPRVWSALETFLRGRRARGVRAPRRGPRQPGRSRPRGEKP
ncbi:MAG: TetR/AcrR family transcriptional regulator [Anaeromyxobacteraceae bacterium]